MKKPFQTEIAGILPVFSFLTVRFRLNGPSAPSCVETQRQWSDLAILRTTPALLGLFSLITVWADGLARDTASALRPNAAAWYHKQEPTFSDVIAAVRRVLWAPPNFSTSRQRGETLTIAASWLNRLFLTLCHAA